MWTGETMKALFPHQIDFEISIQAFIVASGPRTMETEAEVHVWWQ